MSLSQKALIVSFSASMWSARRLDAAASKEVADNHHSKVERAGRYNKCLIDVKAASYTAVVKAVGEARTYFYGHTLPWGEGSAIISASQWLGFSAEMRKLIRAADSAVVDFIDDYPRLKLNAKHELNGLYREADYPTVEEVRSKFGCAVSVLPVPDAGDFRVDLADGELEALREQVTEQVQQAEKKAMSELWQRLHGPVKHLAETLSTKDKIFRDSLVGNVREIVQLLPALNIMADPELEAMRVEVESTLAHHESEDLRNHPRVRAKAAAKAQEISNRMSAMMGA